MAGEALGLVRATLFTYPSLAVSPENVDEITEYVIKRHGERHEGHSPEGLRPQALTRPGFLGATS